MGYLIIFFTISIVFSFLCSIWEAALLSITPSFAEMKFQEKTVFGDRLKSFKDNVDRPLAAILTLNTIAHTVGAIGVGVAATKVWPDNELITGAVVPVVMTLMILFLSEIIPKTLGANYWKQLSGFTVNSLHWIILLLSPLVWVSQLITKYLKKDKDKSVFSRADFTAMAELGAREGVFEKSESKIMKNLLLFNTVNVKDIMTPRTVVKATKETTTLQEFYDSNKNLRFSRIPVYKDSKDNINGYFLKDELLSNLIDGNGETTLSNIMRPITIVNEQLPIPDLFNKLMEAKEHIALVVDEFGGMAGIITMEDVIETLLGLEIMDESDNVEDLQVLARKNWKNRAKRLGIIEDNNEVN